MRKATLLFLLKDNQILLAMKKKGFGVGRWNGVGGKVTPLDQTIRHAAVREAKEEIGVDITPNSLEQVAVIDFHFAATGEKAGFDQEVHVFFARSWEGEPSESDEMSPQWFYQNAIPFDDMWSDDAIWLPLVLQGQKIHPTFHFDSDDQVTTHEIMPLHININKVK